MTATWGDNECVYAFVIKTYKSQESVSNEEDAENLVGTIIDSKLNTICNTQSISSNPYDYVKNSKDFKNIVSIETTKERFGG